MKRVLLPILASAVCLTWSCSKGRDRTDAQTAFAIRPTITRVTDLDFQTGDCIGVTIRRSDNTLYADNIRMVYDGALFRTDGLLWYADTGTQSTVTAYHPYAAEGTPDTFTVAADQRAGTSSSDLLAASLDGVKPGSAAVEMTFRHLLVKLLFTVVNTSSSAVTAITVGGTVPTAGVDLANGSAAGKSGVAAAEIRAAEVTAGSVYQAIVVPQTAALDIAVQTADGTIRTQSIAATTLLSGTKYAVAVSLTDEAIEIRISGAVSDWADGGSLTPDSPGDKNDEPVSPDDPSPSDGTTLTYGGEVYPVGTLGDGRIWMLENLRIVPDGHRVSADPSEESGVWYPCTPALIASTEAAYIREKGLLYDFATALGAATAADAAALEGSQGICPDGWHIPTSAELKALADAYGSDITTIVPLNGYRNGSSSDYIGNAGSAFVKGFLWSSTACDTEKGYALMIQSGASSNNTIAYSAAFGFPVRCIRNR